MKELQLRQHTTCDVCNRKVAATGFPIFWTVTVDRWVVDVNACRRQDGLAALLGNTQLAQVMSPDETLAKQLLVPTTLTVCDACAIDQSLLMAALAKDEMQAIEAQRNPAGGG